MGIRLILLIFLLYSCRARPQIDSFTINKGTNYNLHSPLDSIYYINEYCHYSLEVKNVGKVKGIVKIHFKVNEKSSDTISPVLKAGESLTYHPPLEEATLKNGINRFQLIAETKHHQDTSTIYSKFIEKIQPPTAPSTPITNYVIPNLVEQDTNDGSNSKNIFIDSPLFWGKKVGRLYKDTNLFLYTPIQMKSDYEKTEKEVMVILTPLQKSGIQMFDTMHIIDSISPLDPYQKGYPLDFGFRVNSNSHDEDSISFVAYILIKTNEELSVNEGVTTKRVIMSIMSTKRITGKINMEIYDESKFLQRTK